MLGEPEFSERALSRALLGVRRVWLQAYGAMGYTVPLRRSRTVKRVDLGVFRRRPSATSKLVERSTGLELHLKELMRSV